MIIYYTDDGVAALLGMKFLVTGKIARNAVLNLPPWIHKLK